MSPIIGITDARSAKPAFPRLGKLRKGGERPESGNRPGPDLDHFRFTSEYPGLVDVFHGAYGLEPRELQVFLPYMRIEDAFPTWREEWVASGLHHRCDGQTCTVWQIDGRFYSVARGDEAVPCPHADKPEEQKKCNRIGRLAVILPALVEAGFVGYVTMETHSINDILSIHNTLLAVVEHRGVEDLRNIGFMLHRVEETISTPTGNGKRARRPKWLVKLIPMASWFQAQLESNGAVMELPSGEMLELDTGTGEIVDIEPKPDRAVAKAQEFLDKAVAHYSEAVPGVTEADILKELGAKSAQALAEQKFSMNAAKAQLDAKFSEPIDDAPF